MWDHGGGQGPLSPFWRAVRELDPDAPDESELRGRARGAPRASCSCAAGLEDVEDDELEVHVDHASFEEWWEPYTLGVGPAGDYVAGLGASAGAALRERCRLLVGDGPLQLTMRAWAARGRA